MCDFLCTICFKFVYKSIWRLYLQKEVLKGSEYANATMKTIQLKIIKTAAWVKEMRTKIKIELPQSCTTKTEQIRGYERLIILRT